LGTYRTDLYSGLRKKILPFLGVATFFGGSWFTSKIYVFNYDEYKIAVGDKFGKAVALPVSLSEYIDSNNLLPEIFVSKKQEFNAEKTQEGEGCIIYLSSWAVSEKAIEIIVGSKYIRILKLHPHMRSAPSGVADLFDFNVDACVPAEILLKECLRQFSQVFVLHHGTSVERYLADPRLRFLNVLTEY